MFKENNQFVRGRFVITKVTIFVASSENSEGYRINIICLLFERKRQTEEDREKPEVMLKQVKSTKEAF
jgi:hypothetical protein